VTALHEDGRLANKSLAMLVGLSQSACLARVRKLEADGVIDGYAASVGRVAIEGDFECWACISVEERSSDVFSRLRQFIDATTAIVEAIELAGPFDIVLHAFVADAAAWRVLEEGLAQIAGQRSTIRIGVWLDDIKLRQLPPLRRLAAGSD
jgi:DNA-binding Lrp family transcriptional regulator